MPEASASFEECLRLGKKREREREDGERMMGGKKQGRSKGRKNGRKKGREKPSQ